MTDLSIIAKRPDLPVIVLVDNYDLAYDYDITAQGIYKAEVRMVATWNQRTYDNEEDFVEDYCEFNFCLRPEEKLEAEAHELWEKHAKECIVCYCYGEMIPKGCEIK